MTQSKPTIKPNNPNFSSGPCAKRPGWSLDALSDALLGRSHRSGPGKAKLKEVIALHTELLGIPDDYYVGIVPASDTGAFEMAMWSMLGALPVQTLAWESFSQDWMKDITGQLKLSNVTAHEAEYGQIPDLSKVNCDEDVVFVWNGTTSGACLPDAEWIADDRKGLTFCDATSGVFAYDLPWNKLDVVTWSWQKVLGGEAAHGMLVLSPRAVERLESFVPDRPLPKIFRMTKGGKLNSGIFVGETINTPSMLAVEDCLDALKWVKSIGGLQATIKRTQDNLAAISKWVDQSDWASFLATSEAVRSSTSICLSISDEWFAQLSDDDQAGFVGAMCKILDQEGVAYDIKAYRAAPAGLRIWGGATVETGDVQALLPWLDYAFAVSKEAKAQKAA